MLPKRFASAACFNIQALNSTTQREVLKLFLRNASDIAYTYAWSVNFKIESNVIAIYSLDTSLKHRIVNISLDICTTTNIESDVKAMYSPDKSMKVSWKNIELFISQ